MQCFLPNNPLLRLFQNYSRSNSFFWLVRIFRISILKRELAFPFEKRIDIICKRFHDMKIDKRECH